MNLSIRDANEEDIQDIIHLRRQLDDYHVKLRPDVFINENLYDEKDVKQYFQAKKSKVIVVEDLMTKEIIGYSVLNAENVEKKSILIIDPSFM
ncbi:hypothetical protein AN964_22340 [Heyndrickxia shackletonii]|uniref:GNAT family N-acetyltransferase n=1 Tax=Heyndrickxia shackletonii TaxID=157838 RepID=A0A0Q3WSC9_9BACI|nr:hypothetical protein [Heyndrickxia shackletonii]KQL50407.1 hypothetical protein AN964_22340 [Heyndrickxia shackletonii]MBB2483394.1 hypothetical protein [Bacillus sp. APMAM]NEZ00870.1 hypothetical protein [Heyndrickxia shackletonii]RTZ53181.1 hypothetical protein EKO25_24675 [Bacillus sp. SAJ1]